MKKNAIVITGASTGIGRASALLLAQKGFTVFAGVRKKADGDALAKDASGDVRSLLLDVTDEKAIANAVKEVTSETGGELYGLMNNAGTGLGSAVEITPVSTVRALFEVNVISIFAVTAAFLPLLRMSRGRIVNTGSANGFVSLPARSLYGATKFAVEAIGDSLRVELRPFGIQVSTLEPGVIQTEIWQKGAAARSELIARADPAVYRLYEDVISYYVNRFSNQKMLKAEEVAQCVLHAFTAKKPRHRYPVGKDARFFRFIGGLPSWARDYIVRKIIYK